MSNTTQRLSPLAAYEELMLFAKRRGEFALRLAMHAAVPQGIHPELLHLLKRNFVPEAGDDPALEADILFSPLCEELGRGFFRFDPQVRELLLENLTSTYADERESRIAKVAEFVLAYIDHYDRRTSGPQDQLWRDYLEMQRWVAFGFVDPAGAAQQLAAALENASTANESVARIHFGGLAPELATPLAGFPHLLNYAMGLQALEFGNWERAGELFESLQDEEIRIGDVTLRSASQLVSEWQTWHPEHAALEKLQEKMKFKSDLREEGFDAMYTQEEFNRGQARINYEFCMVDSKVIEALKGVVDIVKAIAALPAIAPHLDGVDFGTMETAIADAYKTSVRVPDIKPPGCESPLPPY